MWPGRRVILRAMDKKQDLTARNFPSAEEDAEAVVSPSRYAGPESAYRLAFTDTEFLLREELRPVRMQLELLKPEMVQTEHGIRSTIVIFGSARILPPEAEPWVIASGLPRPPRAACPMIAGGHTPSEEEASAAGSQQPAVEGAPADFGVSYDVDKAKEELAAL